MSSVEIATTILSIVALIITVVGFFSSLYFYKHGVDLNSTASQTLATINEKAQQIQVQVGGLFEKTLDAAISSRKEIASSFDNIKGELGSVPDKIAENILLHINRDSDQGIEEKDIIETIRAALKPIQDDVANVAKVTNTLVGAQQSTISHNPYSKTDESLRILEELEMAESGLELGRLASRLGARPSELHASLVELINEGVVESFKDGPKVLFRQVD